VNEGGRTSTRIPFGLAALAGLALSISGVVERGPAAVAVAPDAVALVNGRPVTRRAYERAVAALAADRRGPIRDAERELVLDKLIDEELLVQHALALGLAERDERVRTDLGLAMLSVLRGSTGAAPSEEELRVHFEAHPERFLRPEAISVEQRFFAPRGDDADARARALAAAASLRRGEEVAGDDPPVALGRELLTPQALERKLGPTVTRALLAQPIGVFGDPVRSGDGYHVVRVLARRNGELPPFEDARALVERDLARARGDEQLERFLEQRRAEARIERRLAGGE
jgi:hypothetical protein